jgi:Carboxypeptidase regulatory-like domain
MKLEVRTPLRIGAVLFVLFLFAVPRMMAQSDKGAITGKVTDSSGGILQGAEISIEPAGAHAVSDAQGQFFVNNLPAGHYTVTVTYVGFTSFVKGIEVSAGRPVTVDAHMELSSVSTEVIVTAERAAG